MQEAVKRIVGMRRRLIVGISGASGAPLAVELLEQLKERGDVEVHLIISESAQMTIRQETDITVEQLCALADVCHENNNVGASVASGSFQTMGMAIVPCSMKTVAGIVSGYSDNLLLRAADVTLKERRKLVLVPRECPLGTIHLRNLYEVSQLGGVVIPPVLSWYYQPECIADCTRHIVGKIMEQLGFEADYNRWKGM